MSTLTHTPASSYLAEEIPPCTPVTGSAVDPCEPNVDQYMMSTGGVGYSVNLPDKPTGMRYMLNFTREAISHIVLRGTYLPSTVRCTSDNPYQPPSYLRYEEYDLIEHSLSINCYVDIRVSGYVIGNGPSTLTVQRFWYTYWPGEYANVAAGEGNKTEREYIEDLKQLLETDEYLGGIAGREVVLFLGPGASTSAEVWEVFIEWDVQRREDGTVIAVHPERDYWRDDTNDFETHRLQLEMELPAFTQAVTTANQSRVAEYGGRIGPEPNLPMLVTNTNHLRQYYTSVGAYDHPNGPPAQPPAVYACVNGTATSNPGTNRGLVHDCEALLAAKDALLGMAALNWSANNAIASWDGVTASGTPRRVAKLLLPSKSLSGNVPAELGKLFKLTHLDLSSNSLTGEIPVELGLLTNTVELRLSGNSLTGCIPIALRDVPVNDLSSLDLLYCPPAPGGLSTGTPGESGIPLTWDTVSGVSKYRVEYLGTRSIEWTVDDETVTGTTHTVNELHCEEWYLFLVRSYGDGVVHAAEWSEPSAAAMAATTACVSPVFDAAPYTFHISEDAVVGAVVGSVSATDPQDHAITYYITAGNEDGKFAIDDGTGRITVAGELDYETTTSYTLTVEADDGNGGMATVSVVITVTDVAEPTITITGLSNSIGLGESDEFTVTASTVNPSNVYIIQATTNNSNIGFTQSCATTSARPRAFSGRTSYSTGMTLYGCAAPGGTVTVTLRIGSFTAPVLTSAEMEVAVTSTSCSNGTVVPNPDANPGLVGDCMVLLAVKDTLRGAAALDWSPATTIGSWEGVTVGGTPKRVQRLRLEEKGLTGSVPAELGKLDALTRLDLSDNRLTGEIPAALGDLSKLEELDLEYNRLTGAIPPSLGKLTRLTSLDLAENRLSGNPPAELGNLRALLYLSLGSNRLTGPVPTWLSGLSALQDLYLDNNALTGGIPAALGSLSDLLVMSLSRNQLTGTIPSALGSLSQLEELALSRNKLTGPIPDALAGLDLEYLYLSGNALTGCVQAGLRAVANNDLGRLGLSTCPNRAPAFAETSYAFSIAEDAAVQAVVGTVSAMDPDGDAVTYAIAAGNEGGEFAIGAGTGAVTVAGALDYETVASYSLTVEAKDNQGATSTITVSISVRDVSE